MHPSPRRHAAHYLLPRLDAARGFKGVCFYDEAQGTWAVLEPNGRCAPRSASPLAEADTFVVYDDARCRWARGRPGCGARCSCTQPRGSACCRERPAPRQHPAALKRAPPQCNTTLTTGSRYRLQWPAAPIPCAHADLACPGAHCRGADLQLRRGTVGLLTLGPGICKDKVMQVTEGVWAGAWGVRVRAHWIREMHGERGRRCWR
jgi:hypothetical protein